MTKQKAFKRRVRERMSKTGESYAAARSEVSRKQAVGGVVLDPGPVGGPEGQARGHRHLSYGKAQGSRLVGASDHHVVPARSRDAFEAPAGRRLHYLRFEDDRRSPRGTLRRVRERAVASEVAHRRDDEAADVATGPHSSFRLG
jgi:hypothetical protein